MMRKRSIIAIALTSTIAGAALVVWLNRSEIVTGFIDKALEDRDIRANYQIDQLGFGTQRLTNVVIGEPGNPDMTARVIEVEMAMGLSGPTIAAIRVDGVRLRGRWTGERLSFGAVDRLIPPDDGSPLTLPDIALTLSRASAVIDTEWGKIGLGATGQGPLRHGFSGRLAINAPKLALSGCSIDQSEAALRIKIDNQVPNLVGPLGIGKIDCANSHSIINDVRMGLDTAIPLNIEGARASVRVQAGAARLNQAQLASVNGEMTVSAREHGAMDARWSINGTRPSHAMASASGMEITGEGSRDANGAIQGQGTLNLTGLRSSSDILSQLTRARDATDRTPIGPIVTQLTNAIGAIGRGASLTSRYHFASAAERPSRLAIGNITLDAGSGAFFQIVRPDAVQWSQGRGVRLGLAGRFGGGGLPRGSFDIASRGRSLTALSGEFRIAPMAYGDASLAIEPVRFSSDGSGTRFDSAVAMSGPMTNGRVDGLTMAINGRVAADGGVQIDRGCRTVSWQRIALGALVLGRGAAPLCSDAGKSLLSFNTNGLSGNFNTNSLNLSATISGSPMAFQADQARLDLATMRFVLNAPTLRIGDGDGATRLAAAHINGARDGAGFAGSLGGVTGNIGQVPFLFEQGNGDWRWDNGALALNAALQLFDAAEDDRFAPLRSADTRITYRASVVSVTGSLMEPTHQNRVADLSIVHDFSDASGNARFTVAGLNFARDGLQPVMLTPLTQGVAADVVGTVSGGGRVDWSGAGVTSSVGDFSTESMDLSAAFGPVERMSGAIHFNDLIALATPPGQQLRLGSIYPGVEVLDGTLLYQLLPDQRIQIEEGRWPFAGGQLLLRPTILDFDANVPRFLTFDVQGVDAGRFLLLYDFHNINATGIFDGVLPTKFTAEGGRVEGGLLQSRGGGHLEVVGELSQHDLGIYGNLAFGALKSLRYDNMTIRMNGNIDGEMVTEIGFSGLSQGDNVQNNFITRAIRRLPFIFNININAPFREMLHSARGFYDPASLVGENIEALVRAERDARANAAQPAGPAQPARPAGPAHPVQPARPAGPAQPVQPVQPAVREDRQ
ncbi:MAG: YdbH domain-containing protein [Sphingopyxis sp.]